jgi:hypothetical protein
MTLKSSIAALCIVLSPSSVSAEDPRQQMVDALEVHADLHLPAPAFAQIPDLDGSGQRLSTPAVERRAESGAVLETALAALRQFAAQMGFLKGAVGDASSQARIAAGAGQDAARQAASRAGADSAAAAAGQPPSVPTPAPPKRP